MATLIYALVDPNTRECKYVGKTKNKQARMKCHINDALAMKSSLKRNRWILSLLDSGRSPEMVELESVGDDDWIEAEQFWIQNMRYLGAALLNMTDGGDGIHGHAHSEETKRKMSESAKRTNQDPAILKKRSDALIATYKNPEVKKRLSDSLKLVYKDNPELRARLAESSRAFAGTPERRLEMSAIMKGRTFSDETRKKMSDARKGKPMCDVTREALKLAHTGKKHSPEWIQKQKEGINRYHAARRAEK